MKIVYLTWGETPRNSGVFGSQVIRQFVKNKTMMPDSQFYFISGVPVLNSGLVREKWRYLAELKEVKEVLGDIEFSLVPILSVQHTINSTRANFFLNHLLSNFLLYKKLSRIRPDVIHCRSYHAAWAANKIREKFGLDYKVIFDARGFWPEEVSLKKQLTTDSDNYKFLKSVEEFNINSSDIVVSVSDTMTDLYLESFGPKEKFRTVYLSADVEFLSSNIDSKVNRFDSGEITFGYVGALCNSTWHKVDELVKLYSHLRTIIPNCRLTIITPSDKSAIIKAFSCFPSEDVFVTETKTTFQLKKELSKVDIGLMAYFSPESRMQKTLAKTVLAVKSVEYLSSGIPIIVNQNCGGIANLVTEHKLGLSYDSNILSGIELSDIKNLLSADTQLRAVRFSKSNFDYSANGKKYAKIYDLFFGR